MSYQLVDHGFYGYGMNFPVVNPGDKLSDEIFVTDDADFVVWKLAGNFCVSGVSASSTAMPLLRVKITDNQSGDVLTNEPVLWAKLFGAGMYPVVFKMPLILKTPWILAANSVLKVQLENFGNPGITYENVNMEFCGTKNFLRGYYL